MYKVSQFFNRLLVWIAGCFLIAMVLLTCANIFLRLFGLPVSGTFELMGLFGAVAAAFSLSYTHSRRGHISVDVLLYKFSDNTKNIISIINNLICLAFFVVVSWQIAKKATTLLTTGEVTETLRIIYYPFTYAAAFGCLILSLAFLVDLPVEKLNRFMNRLLILIAGCFLTAMILLTCANIFLRLVWLPISGAIELMGFFGAIAAAFSLGYTQIRRGHISVDVLINKFSDNVKNIINTINNVICLVFFTVVAWQVAKKATTLLNTGEVTETLRIIYYPFTYAVAFGCLILSLVFLTDLLKHPEKPDEKEEM